MHIYMGYMPRQTDTHTDINNNKNAPLALTYAHTKSHTHRASELIEYALTSE